MLAIVELLAVLESLIEDFDIEATISKLAYYNGKFNFRKASENENLCKLAV